MMEQEKIIKQWCRPLDEFKRDVKCCANCSQWLKDHTLMGNYMYEFCQLDLNHLTAFDHFCDKYEGFATEENLLYTLTQEERDAMWKKYGN